MSVKINIPTDVKHIIETIELNGYEAFVVGGCVRDSILGRTPNDWDIATDAKPDDIQKIFDKVIPTGIKHGTVTVMINNEGYEVTTYRTDGEYGDNRRPDNVQFTGDIEEDLSRRDFTINAMAYNEEVGLIDPFNGLQDINEKVIRCVGDANIRFNEDFLRMMRAIRFAIQLDFEIDFTVSLAISIYGKEIKNISSERIQSELNKILCSNNSIRKFINSNLLEHIIPELNSTRLVYQNNPHHIHTVLAHSMYVTNNIDNKIHLKLAALLHDIGKKETKTTDSNGIDHFYGHSEKSVEIANRILRNLKYDNKTIDTVLALIKFHDRQVEPNLKSVRRFINQIDSYELFKDWVELRWADISAQNSKYFKDKAKKLALIELQGESIVRMKQPIKVTDLNIDGNDLIKIGYKGIDIGVELRRLLEMILDNPELNEKELLIKSAIENKEI